MKPKMAVKLAVDMAMTLALLLLMAYELIGQAAHEWIGIGMFVLFAAHHILNGRWSKNLPKGRYTALRIWQTALVALVLLSMLGSMISGVILSRHALSFLPIKSGRAFARNLHMVSAYWGFVCMSLHLGFHWSMLLRMAGNLVGKPSAVRRWALRTAAVLLAGYGAYAFVERDIGSYMLLKNQFVFFDFEEPLMRFLFDYITVMGLFAAVGHYLSEVLKKLQKRKPAV